MMIAALSQGAAVMDDDVRTRRRRDASVLSTQFYLRHSDKQRSVFLGYYNLPDLGSAEALRSNLRSPLPSIASKRESPTRFRDGST